MNTIKVVQDMRHIFTIPPQFCVDHPSVFKYINEDIILFINMPNIGFKLKSGRSKHRIVEIDGVKYMLEYDLDY